VLRGLRSLSLRWGQLGPGGVRPLAGSPHLANLRHLDLYGNGLDDEAALLLASSPNLPQLRTLNLWNSEAVTAAGLRALVESPHLPHLHTIRVNMVAQLKAGLGPVVTV
jgi:hypothetical protein